MDTQEVINRRNRIAVLLYALIVGFLIGDNYYAEYGPWVAVVTVGIIFIVEISAFLFAYIWENTRNDTN